jgi:hypothetical protein
MCVFDTLREWNFVEDINGGSNSWDHVLGANPGHPSLCPNNTQTCTKKEFILGVFKGYATQDGDPVYPAQMIDFSTHFQQAGGLWADAAEQFLAFGMIGSHRVEVLQAASTPTLNGAPTLYKVAASGLSSLAVRSGFARYGADMYFNSNLEPVMVQRPSGEQVWRALVTSSAWQYWKFVWRSSLLLEITTVDHLWTTHFSAANALAAASREGLPPTHPLRRLLTIFTFHTIAVNKDAAHQLVGPKHLLHRSTGFENFGDVSKVAQAAIPSLESSFGAFLDNEGFEMLDQTLKDTPYFADGKLLFDALKGLVDEWFGVFENDWCDVTDVVISSDLTMFMSRYESWSMHGSHATTDSVWLGLHNMNGQITCSGFKKWLSVMLFAVTGYHRHVGTVADITSDADFATFSWKDGEASGRPLQHLQMSLIAASTAKKHPKIFNDFTHLAAGLPSQAAAEAVLQNFQTQMSVVLAQINQRNAHRPVPYWQMDPTHVECSVAV